MISHSKLSGYEIELPDDGGGVFEEFLRDSRHYLLEASTAVAETETEAVMEAALAMKDAINKAKPLTNSEVISAIAFLLRIQAKGRPLGIKAFCLAMTILIMEGPDPDAEKEGMH